MTIRFECEGDVAILTIDRPKVHNALDFETSDALWMPGRAFATTTPARRDPDGRG